MYEFFIWGILWAAPALPLVPVGWEWGLELMLSLTSKLIMLTQSVPVISFFSQPFFKRAATPTRRTAAHTHTYTQHELRIHATPGATKTPTGQAARRQPLTSEECGKVLRGEGGRTTGCERASNRSAAKLLKLIKFRLCQHCAYAPYAFLPHSRLPLRLGTPRGSALRNLSIF